MFSLSVYKLLVIVIVGLILFKPKDLGTILYNLGKYVAKFRKIINNLTKEVEDISILGHPNDYIMVDKDKSPSKHKDTKVTKENKNK
ncbi:twin-arginine translocase TatA/TatE family subunit [Rickettsiales bacterium LUAb2]